MVRRRVRDLFPCFQKEIMIKIRPNSSEVDILNPDRGTLKLLINTAFYEANDEVLETEALCIS